MAKLCDHSKHEFLKVASIAGVCPFLVFPFWESDVSWRPTSEQIRILWWALAAIPVSIFSYVFAGDLSTNPIFIYWAQVFSGNWSPDHRADLKGYGGDAHFILGLYVAVGLNVVTLIAVYKLLRSKILKPWSATMAISVKQAIQTRDATVEREILNQLEGTLRELDLRDDAKERIKADVHSGFKVGSKNWIDHVLPAAFPGPRLEKIRSYLKLAF